MYYMTKMHEHLGRTQLNTITASTRLPEHCNGYKLCAALLTETVRAEAEDPRNCLVFAHDSSCNACGLGGTDLSLWVDELRLLIHFRVTSSPECKHIHFGANGEIGRIFTVQATTVEAHYGDQISYVNRLMCRIYSQLNKSWPARQISEALPA